MTSATYKFFGEFPPDLKVKFIDKAKELQMDEEFILNCSVIASNILYKGLFPGVWPNDPNLEKIIEVLTEILTTPVYVFYWAKEGPNNLYRAKRIYAGGTDSMREEDLLRIVKELPLEWLVKKSRTHFPPPPPGFGKAGGIPAGSTRPPSDLELFGLASGAQWPEIKQAYRQMAFKIHPDRNPDDPKATDKLVKVNNAFDRLKKIYAESLIRGIIKEVLNKTRKS